MYAAVGGEEDILRGIRHIVFLRGINEHCKFRPMLREVSWRVENPGKCGSGGGGGGRGDEGKGREENERKGIRAMI